MRMALLPPLLVALTINPWPARAGDPAPALITVPASRPNSPRVLTLPQAVELALSSHPELAAARSEVEAAHAAQTQAGARPNPIVEAEFEDTKRDTRSTTMRFTQPIELGGKRAARLEVADRAREMADSRLVSRRVEVRAAVTTAFFDALSAQERVKLAQASLALATRVADVASKRVISGKASPVEQTKAQVAQSSIRVELLQAQAELRGALQTLTAAVATRQPFDQVEADATVLPAALDETLLEARLVAAPSLRQAGLDVERLGALARVERAKRVPDLTVGLGVKRSDEAGRNQPILTLSIPLPVFDTNQGAELEALRRQDKGRFEAEAAALRLRGEVMRMHERLLAARAEAEALEKDVLPGAQVAHEAASKGFELGKFGFLDVLDAQRTLLQARVQHLRAVAEAHRAAAEIDRLLGSEIPIAPAAQQ